jgi:hypothetical protein
MKPHARSPLTWILAAGLLLAPTAKASTAALRNLPTGRAPQAEASQAPALDLSVARLWESLRRLWATWAAGATPPPEPPSSFGPPPSDPSEGPNNDPVG